MALGPGKYDYLATYVRQQTGAEGVVVIVVDSHDPAIGGISMQAPPSLTMQLPELLEFLAAQIRAEGGALAP
jgi:hypothetical protein